MQLNKAKTLRFDGEVVLVTGAGQGLGRSYAELLASRGARVIVNDPGVSFCGAKTDQSPADDVVTNIISAGGLAVANHDRVDESPENIVAQALDAYGRLDIVINNAGIAGGGHFPDIPLSEFNQVLNVHINGTLGVLRAAWKPLASSNCGRVINTSSASIFGSVGTSPYVGSKAFIFGLTRSLAEEARSSGIRLNTIMPSAYTRLTAMLPDPKVCDYLCQHYSPESVAAFVVWLAHKDTSISGETFAIGGGVASRVQMAISNSMQVDDNSVPESWVGQECDLLSKDAGKFPKNMWDVIRSDADIFGCDSATAFSNLNL
ncbi:SDR family NAD(P)-dependent oxidoreductase [Zhongshania aquimaris]|uniref:SDR family NAD(P)-dependent oxidoreductase n=1 Tax=Zhongshania aquimaris TaxID=2857107 RepID=A0ABS6VV12_9GAMM|nr:SDR family NAD(P)-dependent oxidoreductase [Zhongshania aquimaris]MBW2942182.1 SDR family NAD(P)-dependent oxidoreductase [Zhongshania aquimaris]